MTTVGQPVPERHGMPAEEVEKSGVDIATEVLVGGERAIELPGELAIGFVGLPPAFPHLKPRLAPPSPPSARTGRPDRPARLHHAVPDPPIAPRSPRRGDHPPGTLAPFVGATNRLSLPIRRLSVYRSSP